MAERASVFQATQIGLETTPGTAVAASKRLLVLGAIPTPIVPGDPFRPAGSLFPTTAVRQKEHSEGPVEGRWAFNDLAYIFNSILVAVTPTTPSGATNTRRWTYNPDNFGPNNLSTYTIEQGGSVAAERLVYSLINSITMRATEEEASLTGSMIGRKTEEGITITASPTDIAAQVVGPTRISIGIGTVLDKDSFVDEVQSVDPDTASAGTFTLTLENHTTGNIAYNASAGDVETALTALPNVLTGGVQVTGSGPWTVTFNGGVWEGFNVPLMTMDTTNLTAPGSATVTQTTAGSLTKLVRCHEFQLSLDGRVTMGRTLDPSEESFTYVVERPPDATAQIVLQHDSVSQGYMADMRNVTSLACRINAVGNAIEGNFPYRLRLTFPFKFIDTERGDRNDVWAATYNMRPVYDGTFVGALNVVLDNDLTAL